MPRGKKKTSASANGATVTKTEAVKQALAELGNDAKPVPLQEHIKSKFGLELDTNLISNYKSTLLKKDGGKKTRGRKGKRAKAAKAASQGGISLEDIRAVKQLADRIGADKVRELAEVLAR